MKKLVSFLLALALLAMFTACTSSTAPSGDAATAQPQAVAQATEAPSPLQAAPSEPAATYEKPKFLAVGTGATGAAFYPIGIGIGDVITNNLDIQTTAQVTGGAMENLSLVQEKSIDMGITMGNSALDAYEGTGTFEKKYDNVSAMFGGLSKGYFQIVVMEDSSIQTMEDLKGKRVVMGPAGNGAIAVAETIWNEYGFGINDVDATYIAYTDGISSLTDGNCDAVVVQAAVPSSAIQELAASGRGYRFIPVTDEVAASLMDKYGYFGVGALAGSVYGNGVDTQTMFITNMVIIRADLDESLVYDLTKAVFENIDTVKNSHPAAGGLALEGAVRTSIPLHPGAERYFKEVGAM